MKTYTNEFDERLKLIEHFQKFPAMMPYIGLNYGRNGYKKVLLVGESNYFPSKSTIHLDVEKWYQINQTQLYNDKEGNNEVDWINCRNLLDSKWDSKGHYMYRELDSNLRKLFNTNEKRAMDNISYINAFQRPSKKGESIKIYLKPIDEKVAKEVLRDVINIIQPNIVIFVSKFAWEKIGNKLNLENNIKVNFTCHPATGGRYWFKSNYIHGRNKFNDLLKDIKIQ